MIRVRMQHRKGDPMRHLIEEYNKLRNSFVAGGGTTDAQVIADVDGKDVDGVAAVEETGV